MPHALNRELLFEISRIQNLDWQMKMWSDYVLKNLATGYFGQAEDPERTVEKYDDKFKGSPEIHYGKSKEDWESTAES